MSSEDAVIPEGWERVPSDQLIIEGDMFWHLWYRKWQEHCSVYRECTARDYEVNGSKVIRKKETTDA